MANAQYDLILESRQCGIRSRNSRRSADLRKEFHKADDEAAALSKTDKELLEVEKNVKKIYKRI